MRSHDAGEQCAGNLSRGRDRGGHAYGRNLHRERTLPWPPDRGRSGTKAEREDARAASHTGPRRASSIGGVKPKREWPHFAIIPRRLPRSELDWRSRLFAHKPCYELLQAFAGLRQDEVILFARPAQFVAC